MKKIFISQPMNGKTDEEIEDVRAKAIQSAKGYLHEDVEVIDSFFKDAPVDAKPLWYLGKAIQLLSEADLAVFCAGWAQYRGCDIEHICAHQYGIDCIDLSLGNVVRC